MSECICGAMSTHLSLLVLIDDLPRQCGYRRIDRGLSLRDASAEIGVPVATLHRFEQRRGDPHLSAVVKIVRWLSTIEPIQPPVSLEEGSDA